MKRARKIIKMSWLAAPDRELRADLTTARIHWMTFVSVTRLFDGLSTVAVDSPGGTCLRRRQVLRSLVIVAYEVTAVVWRYMGNDRWK